MPFIKSLKNISKKSSIAVAIVITLSFAAFWFFDNSKKQNETTVEQTKTVSGVVENKIDEVIVEDVLLKDLSILELRKLNFNDANLVIEEELSSGSNYSRYIASYKSEGLKQYGLLTIPNGDVPEQGWPAIIFNHGYIDPKVYKTTERYVAYLDGFASRGYVVFKPDYRGHDNSEGEARGGYSNSDYIIDVLNAFHAVQNDSRVDETSVGMWGHSMGGWITHRAMVIEPDIKAGVIWAGVVGSYADLIELWPPYWVRSGRPAPELDTNANPPQRRWREYFIETYGNEEENPDFWNEISATSYLRDLSGPIQIHHTTGDVSVPYKLAERYTEKVEQAGKEIDTYIYQGDDHNITANFSTAMNRSVDFFNKYLK